MSALMFCVLFNQNILRILKDSIVIPEISAEVTSFAKVYCVTPSAAIFVIIYAKMVNHLSYQKIYCYLLTFFLSFFFIFAFVIYPNVHIFHLDEKRVNELMELYPHFKWYIAIGAYWSYIVFYVLAELWPNIFYMLLFWQFANEITTTEESKRFYTLFSLFGNSSLVIVGLLVMRLSSSDSVISQLFLSESSDGQASNSETVFLIQSSMSLVIFFGMLSAILVRYLCTNIVPDISRLASLKPSSHKKKMGVIDSFRYIAKSRYLWLMLICSAAFGLSANLVEAVFKDRMKELYPTVNSYAEFNGKFVMWTGVTIMFMNIISNNVMRRNSWFVAAVIAPVIMLGTGSVFFCFVVFGDMMHFVSAMLAMSPLAVAVSAGAIQNILAKGTKYSIWDTSREMLYIPLDSELRTKGKAAVDVISSKVGKSSSGLIQSIFFTIAPTATYTDISPFLMIVFIFVCMLWIYAVRKIYDEYTNILCTY
jgi:AAA family ATP:ADP antiporter